MQVPETIKLLEAMMNPLNAPKPEQVDRMRMEDLEQRLSAIEQFLVCIGFNPHRVMVECQDLMTMEDGMYKRAALRAVKVSRDFTATGLSEKGVSCSNRWLDSLQIST